MPDAARVLEMAPQPGASQMRLPQVYCGTSSTLSRVSFSTALRV